MIRTIPRLQETTVVGVGVAGDVVEEEGLIEGEVDVVGEDLMVDVVGEVGVYLAGVDVVVVDLARSAPLTRWMVVMVIMVVASQNSSAVAVGGGEGVEANTPAANL
jgi:hypothetical protein